ncbi:hypothetical protein DEU56DRAFT_816982 [Suillus clintonianus]|uniref:uncharacterized protein n=1 Tax=Suillus clintonianus TaxID=1904413 RepID=UPI001B87CBFA|nr:uncharacterized protein DEU56DRAFT_816982 [Suillus clintonianus]KAG2129607.1 hypothetical protein DEU56DRAFT_816982 [Suillus clintonianus]
MKFTPFTAMIVSATVMAGVAIASDDLVITPQNLPCKTASSVGCATGLKGYNGGNDYGYFCGPKHKIISWTPCSCKKCCRVTSEGNDFTCS